MFELVLFASHPATVNHYEEPSSRCLLQGYRKDSTAKVLTVTPGTHTARPARWDQFCSSLLPQWQAWADTTWAPSCILSLPSEICGFFSICFALPPAVQTVLKCKGNTLRRQASLSSPSAASLYLDLEKKWTWDASLGQATRLVPWSPQAGVSSN